jgi:hypothetical protein
MTALRKDLLTGQGIALSGPVAPALITGLTELGARPESLSAGGEDQDLLGWATARAPLHALVHDARPGFASGGQTGLLQALEQAWSCVAAVANGALIPAQAGRVVLIGPDPSAGAHAEAATAGLENLARTLSVEWARYGITTTAIAAGEQAGDQQLATLVGYLLSPAGSYFSGCRFSLGRLLRAS